MRGATGDYPGMPRWVKVTGILALVVVLLLAAVLVFGPGEHGPGRHASPSSGVEGAREIGGPADADEATRTVEVATFDTGSKRSGGSN